MVGGIRDGAEINAEQPDPERIREADEIAEAQRSLDRVTVEPLAEVQSREELQISSAEDLEAGLKEAVDAIPEDNTSLAAEILLAADGVAVEGVDEGGITIEATEKAVGGGQETEGGEQAAGDYNPDYLDHRDQGSGPGEDPYLFSIDESVNDPTTGVSGATSRDLEPGTEGPTDTAETDQESPDAVDQTPSPPAAEDPGIAAAEGTETSPGSTSSGDASDYVAGVPDFEDRSGGSGDFLPGEGEDPLGPYNPITGQGTFEGSGDADGRESQPKSSFAPESSTDDGQTETNTSTPPATAPPPSTGSDPVNPSADTVQRASGVGKQDSGSEYSAEMSSSQPGEINAFIEEDSTGSYALKSDGNVAVTGFADRISDKESLAMDEGDVRHQPTQELSPSDPAEEESLASSSDEPDPGADDVELTTADRPFKASFQSEMNSNTGENLNAPKVLGLTPAQNTGLDLDDENGDDSDTETPPPVNDTGSDTGVSPNTPTIDPAGEGDPGVSTSRAEISPDQARISGEEADFHQEISDPALVEELITRLPDGAVNTIDTVANRIAEIIITGDTQDLISAARGAINEDPLPLTPDQADLLVTASLLKTYQQTLAIADDQTQQVHSNRLNGPEGDQNESTEDKNDLSDNAALELTMTMDRRSKILSTLSQLLKKISSTADGIVSNIK